MLHLRHVEFLLNCRSLQPGHCQSPGSANQGIPPGKCGAPAPAAPAGEGVPQRRQETLRANWRSPQPVQFQSPGFICGPPLPPSPPPLAFPAFPPPFHAVPIACSPASAGRGVLHLRQAAFLRNCKSPQPGQLQSPGWAKAGAPPPQTPPQPPLQQPPKPQPWGAPWARKPSHPAAPGTKTLGCSGWSVPQRLHAALRAKTRSPQLGHCQSPGLLISCGAPAPAPASSAMRLSGLRAFSSPLWSLTTHLSFPRSKRSHKPIWPLSSAICTRPSNRTAWPVQRGACCLGTPHLRQVMFLANCMSPHVRHCQSPGLACH